MAVHRTKKGSLENRKLRDKLIIAFSLMSVIPLLIIIYLVSYYVFPDIRDIDQQVSLIIVLTLIITVMGFSMVNRTIRSVTGLARDVKKAASGEQTAPIPVDSADEVGELTESVNFMSDRIREYMDQLQDYNHRTSSLKMQINAKVRMMTALLKLEDLLSLGTEFEEVVKFSVEKISSEIESSFCAVFIKDEAGKYLPVAVTNNSGTALSPDDMERQFTVLKDDIFKKEYVVSMAGEKKGLSEGEDLFRDISYIMFPLRYRNDVTGSLFCGTYSRGFQFDEDTIGLLRVFVKSLVLGYSTTQVTRSIKSLESIDRLTGLYTKDYLEERLRDEIDRAAFYQRPCSVIVLKITDFEQYMKTAGESEAKKAVKRVANMIEGLLPKIGKAARYDRDEFVLLLPEANKREAIDLTGRIREEFNGLGLNKERPSLDVVIGVGENPVDGVTAEDILKRAYDDIRKKMEKKGVLSDDRS